MSKLTQAQKDVKNANARAKRAAAKAAAAERKAAAKAAKQQLAVTSTAGIVIVPSTAVAAPVAPVKGTNTTSLPVTLPDGRILVDLHPTRAGYSDGYEGTYNRLMANQTMAAILAANACTVANDGLTVSAATGNVSLDVFANMVPGAKRHWINNKKFINANGLTDAGIIEVNARIATKAAKKVVWPLTRAFLRSFITGESLLAGEYDSTLPASLQVTFKQLETNLVKAYIEPQVKAANS